MYIVYFIFEKIFTYYFIILHAFWKRLDSLREILNRGEEENSLYDSNLPFQQTWIRSAYCTILFSINNAITIVVSFEELKMCKEKLYD